MVVCYTGGGTLGHIYPALSVHQVLCSEPDYHPLWIGRKNEREQKTIEQEHIRFFAIRSGKLRRYWSFANILDIGNILIAFFQALIILKRERPDVIFSKGGFVSVPPVWAAALLRIRIVSHESDASPGLATRLNARFSDVICTAYEEGFPISLKRKLVVSGNPVRSELIEQLSQNSKRDELLFLKPGQKLILVLGGSSGSVQINQLIEDSLSGLSQLGYIYHQCGDTKEFHTAENYTRVPFITDSLGVLLTHADLVVCRAGAGTISELALFGCAALLLPLSGKSTRGDQVDNANHLASKQAARVLYPGVEASAFVQTVQSLLEDEALLLSMRRAIGALAKPESARFVAQIILKRKDSVCNGV